MSSSERLGIMQPGPPGTHRMVLDFSNIILGFDSMNATVERAEKMVWLWLSVIMLHCSTAFTLRFAGGGDEGAHRGVAKIAGFVSQISHVNTGARS
jgi:hypothetical protein